MNATLSTVIEAAAAQLRGQYAQHVVAGRQRWSGADLRGKARRYGAGYARQRRKARAALFQAGGLIVAVRRGLLVTAVRACVDDHGNEVFATPHGYVRPVTAARCAPL